MDLRNNGGGSLYDVVQMEGSLLKTARLYRLKTAMENRRCTATAIKLYCMMARSV